LIGLVGGVLGIVGGIILSGFSSFFAWKQHIHKKLSIVSSNSVIIAISMSVIIGIVAGIIPAYKASKLKPVDALRYE
jgi:putative ABC transport system permease protein